MSMKCLSVIGFSTACSVRFSTAWSVDVVLGVLSWRHARSRDCLLFGAYRLFGDLPVFRLQLLGCFYSVVACSACTLCVRRHQQRRRILGDQVEGTKTILVGSAPRSLG